jgi:cytochrome c peroxidase
MASRSACARIFRSGFVVRTVAAGAGASYCAEHERLGRDRMRNAIAMMICISTLAACGGSSQEPAVAAPEPTTSLSAAGIEEAAAMFAATAAAPTGGAPALPNMVPSINGSGFSATFSKADVIDRSGPFFQSLGVNGRSCSSCHIQAEGWTITPAGVQARFEQSQGLDPIFRVVDGSNSPLADTSTLDARRRAFSMLLSKGLIRVGMPIPTDAEFELAAVDDPYGFASATELSLFRRPLPTANVDFLSTVMWDGRETFKDPASLDCILNSINCFASLHFSLDSQSNNATLTHAEAKQALTPEQRKGIIDFQKGLFTAQVFDWDVGPLTDVVSGGPVALSTQLFYFGINDTLEGDYRSKAPFTPTGMTLFDAWTDAQPDPTIANAQLRERVAAARRSVARGQALFNSKPIQIRGVKGLNDDLKLPVIPGTCTTCHDAPNVGNHSVPLPLDIGVADAARRTADMPLYTLRNKSTGESVQTTDPGRALVTGKWNDIARFKGPILRGLASRAPYFHNGMAKDLAEAVEFYNTRFELGLTTEESADLVAFLRTL